MTMAVPFGFSIGDFIAATQLIRNIWRHASAAANLKGEIDKVMGQYLELFRLIHELMRSQVQGCLDIPSSVETSLGHHFRRCRDHLGKFALATSSLSEHGKSRGSAEKMKQVGQRVLFMTRKDDVLKDLSEDFARDLEAIKLILHATTMYVHF